MSEIEIEAKTVEDAIRDGLQKLGASRENVEIKILNEGSSGLFGLMGNKPARVRLTTKGESQGGEIDFAKAQVHIKEIVSELLKLMGIPFTGIATSLMAGRILVDIKSSESSIIIGKNGQTLEAMESIANLMLNRDASMRVKTTLDVEGYRGRQEERLQNMAKKAADQTRTSGKTYRFDPMSSKERRIVHLALKTEPDIESFSEGDGAYRRVVVKPKRQE